MTQEQKAAAYLNSITRSTTEGDFAFTRDNAVGYGGHLTIEHGQLWVTTDCGRELRLHNDEIIELAAGYDQHETQ